MEYLSQIQSGQDESLALTYAAYGFVAGLVVIAIIVIISRRRILRARATVMSSVGDLREEQAKTSFILNSIEDGVVVIDDKKLIRIINPSAAKMVGWTVDDADGLDFGSVFKFTDAQGNALGAPDDPISKGLAEGVSLRDNNTQMVSKDNRSFFTSIGISALKSKDSKVNGVVMVFRDISAEKAEEKAKADFISTASHEMRTPVAAIEGYLALALNEKVSNIDAKARGFLMKAHESTQHLGKLFQDLLTSTKAEDGRLVSHPVVIEMGEFLEKLSESLKFSAQKKGLLVDYIVGAQDGRDAAANDKVIKPLYYIHADPDRLREVITNIFDNAVKYTPGGKITIGLTGNIDVVQFFVKDTGPGIPAVDVPHLFQKFYRVDNSATRTIGGTGLGLFICKKIVELYKGRIWVESQVGQGSTFYINFPRLSAQKASELQTTEAQAQANSSPLDKR
jgi:two-component system, OmpR family, sensor histidine kinase VicK